MPRQKKKDFSLLIFPFKEISDYLFLIFNTCTANYKNENSGTVHGFKGTTHRILFLIFQIKKNGSVFTAMSFPNNNPHFDVRV